MTDTFRIGAVILAGGRGSRMHSDIQKQYMLLDGRPLIAYALEAFERSCADDLVLVTGAGEAEFVQKEILPPLGLTKLRSIVTGGKERYHSVYEGLKALRNCDYVLIHDGARPLVTEAVISRAVQAAVQNDACVVGMPVKDTIKIADENDFAVSTPRRDRVWMMQTPQVFSADLIKNAYRMLLEKEEELRESGVQITDDAMVVETLLAHPVKLFRASYENIKLTTPEDLLLADGILEKRV